MGGFGSGRWHRWGSKRLTEDSLALDINLLARRHLLIPDCRKCIKWSDSRGEVAWAGVFLGADPDCPMLFMELHRQERSSPDAEGFAIPLELTPQHFGGRRRWLCCPLCGRRVAKLYLPPGEMNFGCRTCHALTYWSTKSAHQAERARASLGRTYARWQHLLNDGDEGRIMTGADPG